MFYFGKRVVFILVVCCLAILLGKAINDSYAAVLTRDALYTPVGGAPDTRGISTEQTLAAREEKIASIEVNEYKQMDYEKVIAEVHQAIADAEELLNRLEGAENTGGQVHEDNLILAGRGGYRPYIKVPQYDLSDVEYNLMAQVVQAEAGGEPYEGQIAVANVIFNRVKAGWGRTVTEVINQKWQFTKVRKEPSDSVKEAVREALYGRNAVPEGTLFFQNLAISTDFTIPNSKEYVTKIGMHNFYR